MPAHTVERKPIFATPAPLPRGPHDLSRDEVGAAHRARLLAALTTVVAEKGYAGTTIGEVARIAGVSPNVFYAHFAGKEACFLAAYEVFSQALLERITEEIAPADELGDVITLGLRAYLSTLAAEPKVTRAFLLETDGAGPAARGRRHEAYAAIAAVIAHRHRELAEDDPRLGRLPDLAYVGMVHGIRELVCDSLGRADGALTDLEEPIAVWLTATFRGAATITTEGAPS